MSETSIVIDTIRKRLGKRLCIMGHHYEDSSVIRHCDFTGDSLELARRIPDIDAEWIVFCGVSFMGETAALLAKPGQQVLMPAPEADCQMARMASGDMARKVLQQLEERTGHRFLPIAYVNTDASLKAVVGEYGGTVCTSANARAILQWAFRTNPYVLFVPDMHLGRNAARQIGLSERFWHVLKLDHNGIADPETQPLDRHLLLWPGYCPIHADITPSMVNDARFAYQNARIVVHPEASPEVVAHCDAAGSTSFLIKDAESCASAGKHNMLVVGTEVNLVRRLSATYRNRLTIVPLWDKAVCPDMAMITPEKLLSCLEDIEMGRTRPIMLDQAICEPARLSISRMLEVSR